MTRWLEEKLGATVPLEVLIRFRPESRTTILDRMRLVAAMDAAVRRLPGATGCLSAATFAPPFVTEPGRQGILPDSLLRALLRGRRGLLRANGWLAEEGDVEAWRISLRMRGMDDLDYEAQARAIRRSIEPLLAAQLGADRRGVDLVITGTAPIVFKARRSLLDGMLIGLGTDIALDRRGHAPADAFLADRRGDAPRGGLSHRPSSSGRWACSGLWSISGR